jgi:WG containing repeat
MKRVITLIAVGFLLVITPFIGFSTKSNSMLIAMMTAIYEQSEARILTEGITTPRYFSEMPVHRGFINTDGRVLFKSTYDDLGDFHEGLAAFRKGRQWGFVDKQGKEVIAPQFSRVRDFSEGLAAVRVDKVWTYCNRRGRLIIKPSAWCSAGKFKSGMAIIKQGAKYGLVNQSGDLIHPIDLDSVDSLADGMHRVKRSNKFGFLDKSGKAVVEPKYDDATDFSEGLAAVAESGKWGYIDKSGVNVIPFTFKLAQEFRHGKAVVKDGNKFQLINRDGRKIGKSEFAYMTAISDVSFDDTLKAPPMFVPVLSGSTGWNLVDVHTGKEISKVAFASVSQFSDGAAAVEIFDNPQGVKQELAARKSFYQAEESSSGDAVESDEKETDSQNADSKISVDDSKDAKSSEGKGKDSED